MNEGQPPSAESPLDTPEGKSWLGGARVVPKDSPEAAPPLTEPGHAPEPEPPGGAAPETEAPLAPEQQAQEDRKTPEEKYIINAADEGKTLAELIGEVKHGWQDRLNDDEVEQLRRYLEQGYMAYPQPLGPGMEAEFQSPPKKVQTLSDRLLMVAQQDTSGLGQIREANHALVIMFLARYGAHWTSYPLTRSAQEAAHAATDMERRQQFESPEGLDNRTKYIDEMDCFILDEIGLRLRDFQSRMKRLLTAGSMQNF